MDNMIEVKALNLTLQKTQILKNINVCFEKNKIHGLIGRNGSGKTMLMKCICGFVRPTSGNVTVDGKIIGKDIDFPESLGLIIETPGFIPYYSGYRNLKLLAGLRKKIDKEKIRETIRLVGLDPDLKRHVRKYSLGMRQRLGIAMALLTKPAVLVLDEPVNGLDPEGIVEVRHILQKLSEDQGVTILISSHLLSELSELCTDFSIINKGQLVENLSLEELHDRCRSHIVLRTNNTEKTAAVLEDKLSIGSYKVLRSGDIEIYEQLDAVERISKTVTDSGCIITKLYESGQSLEDYYLEKVGGSHE